MEHVQFEDENQLTQPALVRPKTGGLQDLLIRFGVARDAQHAQKLMLMSALIAIVIAVLVYVFLMPETAESPRDLDVYIQKMKNIRPPR